LSDFYLLKIKKNVKRIKNVKNVFVNVYYIYEGRYDSFHLWINVWVTGKTV